jgi:DNA-binding NarL/FixJ family response regulator
MKSTTIRALSFDQRAAGTRPEPAPAPQTLRPVDVVVVDDNIHTGHSMWALLRWRQGIRVVGAVASSEEARAVIADARPDVCLVSAALGPDFIRGLTQLPDAPPVLVYAGRRSPALDASAALAGAERVIWRYADPDELIAAIQATAYPQEGSQEFAAEEADGVPDHGDVR